MKPSEMQTGPTRFRLQYSRSTQGIMEESRLTIIRSKSDLCQQFQQQSLGMMQFIRQPEKHSFATVLVCLILLFQCGLIIQDSFCIRIKHSSHIIHVKIINYKVQCVRYWMIYMSRHAFIVSNKPNWGTSTYINVDLRGWQNVLTVAHNKHFNTNLNIC